MSRTGKKPIVVPDKVKVKCENGVLVAEGPLGKEEVAINPLATVVFEGSSVVITRQDETPEARAVHGLVRALVANAVQGVSTGFKRDLEINGVGYRAEVKGEVLKLTLGYSHPIEFDIPKGIKIAVADQTKVAVTGSNRELVGRVASKIRGYKPPEPYKGKGIKYSDEVIIRKVGKAAGGK